MQSFLYFLLNYMQPFGLIKTIKDFIEVKLPFEFPSYFSKSLGSLFDTEYDIVASGGGLQDMFTTYVNPNSSIYSEVWPAVQTLYNALAIIGCSFTILFWVLSIADKLTKDRLTGHELIRSGIEIIIAFMFIVEGFNLFTGIMNFSQNIYDTVAKENPAWSKYKREYAAFFTEESYGGKKVSEWTDDLTWDTGTLSTDCKVHGWGGMFSMFVPVVKVCLMALVAQIGCMIGVAVMVSRVIQMGVYVVFAPLAIADLFNGVMNSPGFRYLKKFFAVCLQGATICVIMYITMALQKSFLDIKNSTFMLLIPSLIMVTLILKSQQLTNDIVGV